MKEVASLASNELMLIQDDGKLVSCAEVILVLSEPFHELGGKVRRCENVRFVGSAKSLRQLAEALTAIAEQCDKHKPKP